MGKTPKMSWKDRAKRREEMVAAVRKGVSLTEAAARFGVGREWVYKSCRRAGLTFGVAGRIGRSAQSRKLGRKLAKAADAGRTVKEVALAFGVSTTTVRLACKRHGASPKPDRGPRHLRLADERANARRALGDVPRRVPRISDTPTSRAVVGLLLATDLPLQDIGDRAGVSRQRVHQIWRVLRAHASSGEVHHTRGTEHPAAGSTGHSHMTGTPGQSRPGAL